MKALKETIKQLAAEQHELKNQRKTVKIIGPRNISAYAAFKKHQENRCTIRHMLAAYAILRGKEDTGDLNAKDSLCMQEVMAYIEQFEEKEEA